MDASTCRSLFATADVAVLATTGDRGPHLVPIVFSLRNDVLISAIDHKSKSTTALRRLENIRRNEHVAVLAHHYDDAWDELWWVRGDGRAREARAAEVDLTGLVAKYRQYREHEPHGPVIEVTVERWVGWSAGIVESPSHAEGDRRG